MTTNPIKPVPHRTGHTKYTRAQDAYIAEHYGQDMTAGEIAAELTTEARPVTKNMVIGRYSRMPTFVKTATAPIQIVIRLPPPPAPKCMKWGTRCACAECTHQPIQFSSHGYCHKCNAKRLNHARKQNPDGNAGYEVGTPCAGYMGQLGI